MYHKEENDQLQFRAPSTEEGVLSRPSHGPSVYALLMLMVYSISHHTHTRLPISQKSVPIYKTPVQRLRRL